MELKDFYSFTLKAHRIYFLRCNNRRKCVCSPSGSISFRHRSELLIWGITILTLLIESRIDLHLTYYHFWSEPGSSIVILLVCGDFGRLILGLVTCFVSFQRNLSMIGWEEWTLREVLISHLLFGFKTYLKPERMVNVWSGWWSEFRTVNMSSLSNGHLRDTNGTNVEFVMLHDPVFSPCN